MEIIDYLSPLDAERFDRFAEQKSMMGAVVRKYTEAGTLPDLTDCHIAIFGVGEDRGAVKNAGCGEAPDQIRDRFYALKQANYPYKIVDLGNLRIGETLGDTYAAVSVIMVELLRNGIVPVVLGGSQDLTLAQYMAYQKLEETVNIVAVDAHFNLGKMDDPISADCYVGKIVIQEPNFLFNYSNVGYQNYFVGTDQVELMEKLYFDAYRLGNVRNDMEEVEPIVRNADLLSFDITAVRQSDAPGNGNASPNGFYGEEACQIVRYAGMSDKLTSFGLYEVNPTLDFRSQTSHLAAQMLWYFLEGYYNRKRDVPLKSKTGFLKYRVSMKQAEQEIVFYKSEKSERWWMEVPVPSGKSHYHRHHLVPCSYKDYETACRDEMPDRWWQAFQKLS
jgi:arginase family enzyme